MKFYYHISSSLNEPNIRLEPRKDGPNRDPTEPNIPRICVCPTISKCFLALPYLNYAGAVYNVYRTTKKIKDVYKPNQDEVCDVIYTNEVWLLKPTTFVHVGVVLSTGDMPFPVCIGFEETRAWKKYPKALEKIKEVLKNPHIFVKVRKGKVRI